MNRNDGRPHWPTRLGLAVLLGLGQGAVADSLVGEIRSADGSPLSGAVVFIEAAERGPARPPEHSPVITQRNRTFLPRVLPVLSGTTVEFLNEDPELHTVHACCSPENFNFSFPKDGMSRRHMFDRPGIVTLLCDIHHDMRAFVVVLSNPYFALTDENGRYRLSPMPVGEHLLRVWHESHVTASCSVVAGEDSVVNLVLTPLSMRRESSGDLTRGADSGLRKEAWDWEKVVREIGATLDESVAEATAGRAERACKLASDAYFAYFEGHGMETAIRQNISARRVFELEEMFGEIRRKAASGALGQAPAARLGALEAELMGELRSDARELVALGVVDEAWDAAEDSPAAARPERAKPEPAPMVARAGTDPAVGSTGVSTVAVDEALLAEVISGIEKHLAEARTEAARGRTEAAEGKVSDAYFGQFHRVESALAAQWPGRTARLEGSFAEMRGLVQAGAPDTELVRLSSAMVRDLRELRELTGRASGRPWVLFLSSFLIIFREGFEAILVFVALVTYLARVGGDTAAARPVYFGGAAALVASIATAFLLSFALQNAGTAQETLEGFTLLLASAVLFAVSGWFIGKAQAGRWHRYIREKVDRSLNRGSVAALGIAAFLAVYREGAETVLFYQALYARAGQSRAMFWAGFTAGACALTLVYVGFRKAIRRLPLGVFFAVSSAVLFALAVVFAGQGVSELQSVGFVSITPLRFLPNISVLGLRPTLETFVAQSLLLGVMVVMALFLLRRRPCSATTLLDQ
ncbi:MAG: FTR1 family protein [Planctomycetes bacterium]|nr:FTR1 family protein [Planctomycetota bacterium]